MSEHYYSLKNKVDSSRSFSSDMHPKSMLKQGESWKITYPRLLYHTNSG